MCDLKGASNSKIIFRIDPQDVSATINDKIGFRLQASDMFGDEKRCADHFAKSLVRESGNPSIAEGVLVPAKARLVTDSANGYCISESADLAGWIQHERHAIAKALTQESNDRALFRDISVIPTMHLESAITQRVTLFGKI